MNTNKIQEIMATVKSFPGMPVTATKLLSMLDKPDTDVVHIENVLKYDPGLTANVLKLTNSAYFGLPSKIGSVKQAVILLGSKRLIQLVLASCVRGVMDKAIVGYGLTPGALWRHSIAVSVAAETLVAELNILNADVIFTAALLHDLGKLAMGNFVKDDLKKIENTASQDIPFEVAEQFVLGIDHAEIGALILKNWSFPHEIVTAVRWHHAPDAGEETNDLIDIVHVANVLSMTLGIGVGREGLRYKPSMAATKRLGVTAAQLEKVASQTLQWASELADVLDSN